jgi:adenosylmethionine-8-amino-7-oxononanoate aminotransferase
VSYHGATIGALSMTGHYPRRRKYLPLLAQFPRISTPYCRRCPYHLNPKSCHFECAHELERVILAEDPENISAFIAEPIIGASAPAVAPPPGYYRVIKNICHKYNVLFIADEVMTGYGRTGKFFAMEHYEVFPDMIALSKGISSGYTPLGALIVDQDVYDVISGSPGHTFIHGHTFAGNPLSAAVGLEVIRTIQSENLVPRVAELGEYFHHALKTLKKHPTVFDVRCKGLLAGVEFMMDRKNRKPHPAEANIGERLQRLCLDNGLYVYPGRVSSAAGGGDHILLAPPFTITKAQLDTIVEILDRSIAQLEMELGEAGGGRNGTP